MMKKSLLIETTGVDDGVIFNGKLLLKTGLLMRSLKIIIR